ncbi:MAG: helix-turn-helix transcriptional regulator [candidate division NC10 bacterium]|nr:helix-turn-helix transcriptional regulator [candidate division NC10 bacterium]MDE2322838.1 helix-turn-helix transcriptional regulator [candidate division NC10 bacterium]
MVKTFRSGIGKGFTLVVTKLACWQKASAVIKARNRAGLTQQQLARRMGTTQPVVARLESGRTRPSMRTLERLAEATRSRLLIRFEPREGKRREG